MSEVSQMEVEIMQRQLQPGYENENIRVKHTRASLERLNKVQLVKLLEDRLPNAATMRRAELMDELLEDTREEIEDNVHYGAFGSNGTVLAVASPWAGLERRLLGQDVDNVHAPEEDQVSYWRRLYLADEISVETFLMGVDNCTELGEEEKPEVQFIPAKRKRPIPFVTIACMISIWWVAVKLIAEAFGA